MASLLLVVETVITGLLLGAVWSHTSVGGSRSDPELARDAVGIDPKTDEPHRVQIVHETLDHKQQMLQRDQLGARRKKTYKVDCRTLCDDTGLCNSPEFYECLNQHWTKDKYGVIGRERTALDAFGRQTVYNQLKQKW